ncbi:hypothetical protein RintRC_2232 [Richelia intracellularis]|nr:hypothetical protein RintRC_2232 [Richelia intracellularis]
MAIPNAKVVVATVGKPSGTGATARDMNDFSIPSQLYPRNKPTPNTKPHTAVDTTTS